MTGNYRRRWDATYLSNQERAERMALAHAGLLADRIVDLAGEDEYQSWCDTLPDEQTWHEFCQAAEAHLSELEARHEKAYDLRDDAVIRHPARSTCSEYQTVDRVLT